MTPSLLELFPEGSSTSTLDVLDSFLSTRLFEAGIWKSPRNSDGVSGYRVRERSEARVRVSGQIWTIDQVLRAFWLDIERDPTDEAYWSWALFFDVDASASMRHRRDAIDVLDSPDAISWKVTLAGRVARRDLSAGTD